MNKVMAALLAACMMLLLMLSSSDAATVTTTSTTTTAATKTTNAFKGLPKLNFTLPKLPNVAKVNFTLPKNIDAITVVIGNRSITFSPPGGDDPFNGQDLKDIRSAVLAMATDTFKQLVAATPLVKIFGTPADATPTTATVTTTPQGTTLLTGSLIGVSGQQTIDITVGVPESAATGQPTNMVINTNSLFSGPLGPAYRSLLTTNNTELTPEQIKTNAQKLASRINVAMANGWLILFTGLKIGSACIQLLSQITLSLGTGTVSVDPALVLKFADLATNLNAAVSYLLYAIFKETADTVAPLSLAKAP